MGLGWEPVLGEAITIAVIVKEKIITKNGEFYKVEVPANEENLMFRTTIIRPGDILE